MNERHIALTKLYYLMCEKYNIEKKDVKFLFDISDKGDGKEPYKMCYNKTLCKNIEKVGPDWTCWWWKSANIESYQNCIKEIQSVNHLKPQSNKLGWVGNIFSANKDVEESKTRPYLYQLGIKYSTILEIIHISPVNGQINEKLIPNYMTIIQQIKKYKYLLDIGGNGYSGRLKLLLFSKRPVFIVDRTYVEYFDTQLKPMEHFIPVNKDLSNLIDQYEWCEENPEKCKIIALNALKFAQENLQLDNFIERMFTVIKEIGLYNVK